MSANPPFIYKPTLTPYLELIYQDEDLVVLNKPSGILTVEGRLPEHQDCLEYRVQRVLPSATIVHRLDMATSGILIMALNKPSHIALSRQFERRQTQKTYIARVHGHLQQPQGEIDLPLTLDWPNRPKQMVCLKNGKQAITRYKLLHQEQYSSVVELTPITGRSHQLRVHMLALGHPILGDRLYAPQHIRSLSPRLQLHSQDYIICHPRSGDTIAFHAPCPFFKDNFSPPN